MCFLLLRPVKSGWFWHIYIGFVIPRNDWNRTTRTDFLFHLTYHFKLLDLNARSSCILKNQFPNILKYVLAVCAPPYYRMSARLRFIFVCLLYPKKKENLASLLHFIKDHLLFVIMKRKPKRKKLCSMALYFFLKNIT